MSHELDTSNGRYNIAWTGKRSDIWHRHGQQMQPGMSIEDWATAAGLDWEAQKVPAYTLVNGTYQRVENAHFVARNDTHATLSGNAVSDQYKPVQPAVLLKWFSDYILVDDRFQLDVAGSLKGGAVVWATATFNGEMTVGGDKHRARLLATTTFDGSGATINKGTMTRVICANTMRASFADRSCEVRTRHNTHFNPKQVAAELARIAQGFETYKAIGDAMAQTQMAAAEVSQFFKACLDIPFDAPQKDVSTRKLNQFADLNNAYAKSVDEGAENGSVWAALQALTRYVDHDRSARGDDQGEARFASANFGSGDTLKGKAMGLLMPRIADRVTIPA